MLPFKNLAAYINFTHAAYILKLAAYIKSKQIWKSARDKRFKICNKFHQLKIFLSIPFQ